MIVDTNLPQKIKLGGEYNVESVINEDGTQTLNITTAEKAFDRLQWKCDNIKTLHSEFQGYINESLDEVLKGLDTSKVTDTDFMFYNCSKLIQVPLFDTSNVTNMNSMFRNCTNFTTLPKFNTSNATNMGYFIGSCSHLETIPQLDFSNLEDATYMFSYCSRLNISQLNTPNLKRADGMFYACNTLTSTPLLNMSNVTSTRAMFRYCKELIEASQLDTRNVKYMMDMFYSCPKLTTIHQLDLINATETTRLFEQCSALTNLTLKNIKVNLTIGSGTSWGHLLTLDSLINTIKELWDYSNGTKTYTLQMSTPSKELIANTYVKLITATEEMIADDPYIESKMPCEVCESTDEGAMLLTDYATLKKWTIA